MSSSKESSYYIGLMSGTSLDAMDGVLADMSSMPPKITSSTSIPFNPKVKQRLLRLNIDPVCSLKELAGLDAQISIMAAQAVSQLLSSAKMQPQQVRAVGYSGQTIAHNPADKYTMQIGDPNILSEMSGISVVADLRRRDVAAGGQGAPLASGFHQECFSNKDADVRIINLGGISNITMISKGEVISGFDLGPANCLMDEWTQKHLDKPYDDQGKWASSGQCLDELLYSFLQDPYFSKTPPKSTGRDYFNLNWLQDHLTQLESKPKAADVQATLADLSALSICLGLFEELKPSHSLLVYFAGGGTRNTYLMERIKKLTYCEARMIDELGVPAKLVEPLAFAWLAKRSTEGESGNLPAVTHAVGERVLGGIYHS